MQCGEYPVFGSVFQQYGLVPVKKIEGRDGPNVVQKVGPDGE